MPWGAYLDVSWLSMCPACSVYSSWTEIIFSVFTLTTYRLFSWAQTSQQQWVASAHKTLNIYGPDSLCIFPMTWPCHCHLEAVRHRVSPLADHFGPCLVPAVPSVTRRTTGGFTWWFQQPAAGWRQEAQAAAETDQPHRGLAPWSCSWTAPAWDSIHNLPQSLSGPQSPEAVELRTFQRKAHRTYRPFSKVERWFLRMQTSGLRSKNGSNSDCILESLTALKNQLLDGPHSRQIRVCGGGASASVVLKILILMWSQNWELLLL